MLASSHPIAHAILALIGVVGLLVYLIPTFVALVRKHHWIVRIALVNVLLGWTVIGWIVALHMASTSRTRTQAYWRPGDPNAPGAPASFVPARADESGVRVAPAPATAPAPLPPTVIDAAPTASYEPAPLPRPRQAGEDPLA